MRFETLIETLSAIVNSEEIYKDGMTIIYELPEKRHKQMDEHLFYKSNPPTAKFEHREVVELEVEGILVKFIKEGSKIEIKGEDLEDSE